MTMSDLPGRGLEPLRIVTPSERGTYPLEPHMLKYRQTTTNVESTC